MKVWTTYYRPFILGGNVNAPVHCILEPAAGPFDLGKGYKGYLVVAPSGKTYIVEAITGGIVGNTIEEVRDDVAVGDEEVIEKQIEDAFSLSKESFQVSPDVFWKMLKESTT